MRSGTHYLASALAQVYHYRPALFKDGAFVPLSDKELSKGLYEKVKVENYDNGILYVNHYYHILPKDLYAERIKVLYLIGFPYDSFYSDGLVFSSKEYSVQPSSRNKGLKNYKFRYGSKEWNFLQPYMIKNACWLEELIGDPAKLVVRYEDFFINFNNTIHAIEKHMGKFRCNFPVPKKNSERIYWSGKINYNIDDKGIKELSRIFEKSLKHFYI